MNEDKKNLTEIERQYIRDYVLKESAFVRFLPPPLKKSLWKLFTLRVKRMFQNDRSLESQMIGLRVQIFFLWATLTFISLVRILIK